MRPTHDFYEVMGENSPAAGRGLELTTDPQV
jgi:hypothetical protein